MYTKSFLDCASYNLLCDEAEKLKKTNISNLIKEASRNESLTFSHPHFFFDFSKNLISQNALALFEKIGHELQFEEQLHSFFAGQKINKTEDRAVLHTSLRDFTSKELRHEGKDILKDVRDELEKMRLFCDSLHNGLLKGFSGKTINTIVNIGIGGSDLGPQMVVEALKPYQKERIKSYFVSNVDATHLAETVKQIDLSETLFIVASKTFTTQETMTNALSAKALILAAGATEKDIEKHFIALSTNTAAVEAFGIAPTNIFRFWDWVGGRYSLWSAIGMSIACSIGYKNFEQLLKGAHAMDKHFANTPLQQNVPYLMAFIGIFYSHFFNAQSHVILAYDQYLWRFAAYLQQADMESNGKSTDRNGKKTNYHTGQIIWGEPGTNGQHSFYQLLHQGSRFISADFIGTARSHNPMGDHHQKLLANFFAQSQALMKGLSQEEVCKQLEAEGLDKKTIDFLTPYKVFEGNRPSNSIFIKQIGPFELGYLTALYEHKIYVQGILLNLFSFDQMGVELGKQLAKNILPELLKEEHCTHFDFSSNSLINKYKEWR